MRKIIMKVTIDKKSTIDESFIEIRRILFKKEIAFSGILIEVKNRMAYIWKEAV